MLILSQDRRTIVNFDNMKTIELDSETNFTSINIFRETNEVETGVCGLFIGHYATEERAKEVLKDICGYLGLNEMYKYGDSEVQEMICKKMDEGNGLLFIYEMPKE